MTIKFFHTASENNRLTKVLLNEYSMEGTLRSECSFFTPVITIEFSDSTVLFTWNYFQIVEADRYYFITDITSLRNNLWRITGKIDVLMSYNSDILSLPVILENTEVSAKNMYLQSPIWVSQTKCITDVKQFPSGFNNNGEFILITAGG